MNMTRKLIPALAMLLVSAIMLSTASYAWFATQTSVSASGLQVKAKSEAKYLWISADGGTNWKTAVEITDGNGADPYEVSLVSATIEGKKTVSWFTAAAADPNASTKDDDSVQSLDPIDQAHALIQQFKFKADAGSVALENLKITEITVQGNEDDPMKGALRILAVSSTGAQLWVPTVDGFVKGTNPGTYAQNDGKDVWTLDSSSATSLVASMTPDTAYDVTVYAYYDGESEYAYTNNADNLLEANIAISFGVDN